MSGCTCLYRRASGIYAVRLVVPARLRELVGRGEVHVSTGVRDANAAKLAASRILSYWRERFMQLDGKGAGHAGSWSVLAGDGALPILDAAQLLGISPGVLLSELAADRGYVYVQAQNWRGWHVPDIDDIERDHDGSFILNDVERKGDVRLYSGVLRCHGSAAAYGGLIAEGRVTESLFLFPGTAAFFAEPEQEIRLAACMVTKPAVSRIRERLGIHAPATQQTPAVAPLKGDSTEVTEPPLLGPAKYAGMRFSALFELYRNHRSWGEDQTRRMSTEAGLFIELMDDPVLGSIDVAMIHKFAERLSQLPSDVYQAKRRWGVQSLRDLVEVSRREGLQGKAQKTVRGHVGRIAEVLNFADDKGMMHGNPATGFEREWGIGGKARPQDEREAFTNSELQSIFSQQWFSDGAGVFSESGNWTNWRPFYFWMPLLGLTSGGRLNELAQLYLDDIRQSEEDSAVWYLDFNLNQPDKLDADMEDPAVSDKSLKTVNAVRVVPIHEAVIQAGLIDYVAELRKAGHVRLFPELSRDRVKGYGKPAGSWFNERFLGRKLGLERNGRKTFHSLRHNFITALERLDLTERVMAQLAGHERGKTQSATRYAKDRSAAELKPTIDRLVFPRVVEISRFDIDAGMKALTIATRYKKAVAHRRAV